MQQPQSHQDAHTQPSIQFSSQQQIPPQVMLCPLQYVYDPQQVLLPPSEEHVQPAQPVQQSQPIQHQTYIINVQNPPPWIQNRTNMVYMPQVVNNVPYLHQNVVQNPMINYQYQPMIIQQDLRQLPMTQMQNQSLINQSLIQQQNLLQKQQSLLQNQQNSQASQATKILQAQQIQNQQRLLQNSQNLVQNQQLMQTAQIVQSPQRINSQSIIQNQPKMITQQGFIINHQDALIKNAQTLAQNTQIPTQVVRQRIQTPQIMQNQRMMLIPQSIGQNTLTKQKSTPVLAHILQAKAQPGNQTEMMTPMIITRPVNQTEASPITMKPQYHIPQMIAVNSLANYATNNGPNSPNDTTVPQHIRNQIPEGLSVKTIVSKGPTNATMRPNPGLDDPRSSKPLTKSTTNSTTNTENNYKRKIPEKKNETPAKKAKMDNRVNVEAAKARLDADKQQKEDKQLRNTVYVQARGRINETGETSMGSASVSTEGIDPNILTLANIFVNANNFKINTEAVHVTENKNHEYKQKINVQPNVNSESFNASIENSIENVVRHVKENENTITENIPITQISVQNLLTLPIETQILPIETQMIPIETQILPMETQILPNEHKTLSTETKIIPNTSKPLPNEPKILPKVSKPITNKPKILPKEPKLLPKEPRVLPNESKLLLKEPQVLPNETKPLSKQPPVLTKEPKLLPKEQQVLTKEPELLPKKQQVLIKEPKLLPKEQQVLTKEPELRPKEQKVLTKEPEVRPKEQQVLTKEPELRPKEQQVLTKEPEILPNETDNNKSLNDMKMALDSMNRNNSASEVNIKKIDKCEKENSVKDKKNLINDSLKKKHLDGIRLDVRVMREKVERFVLTHVLDGHIIQESNVPFVVQKSSIPLYRNPPKVIQSPIKEEKPDNNSSVIKTEEEDSSNISNKKTEHIKNNVKPKESETGGPSPKKETRLSNMKTETKKEKESRKLELSKSKEKEKERHSNRIQLRKTNERERESRRITEREDRLLNDNDKSKKEKAEVTVKEEKQKHKEEFTRNLELKAESKELNAESKEPIGESTELKAESKELKTASKKLKAESKELKTETEEVRTKYEKVKAEAETELDSETVNQETEENPFENVDIPTVKSWTATTLYDHLNQHNWHETAQKLNDEEIDGESLLLVNTEQLTQIGISDTHAAILGAFIENELEV